MRDRLLSHLSYDAVTLGFKSVFFSFFLFSFVLVFKGASKNRRKDECKPCVLVIRSARASMTSLNCSVSMCPSKTDLFSSFLTTVIINIILIRTAKWFTSHAFCCTTCLKRNRADMKRNKRVAFQMIKVNR